MHYNAHIFFNSGQSFEVESDDLNGLKDVLCTFSYPRLDLKVIHIFDSKKTHIGSIKRGKYEENKHS